MKITLTNAGKRFNRDWIFRHVNYHFESGKAYAITGPNGSGKSTLLQLIGGAVAPSEGGIRYQNPEPIAGDLVFRELSLAAPYLELIEEMTLIEFLEFHRIFKPFLRSLHAETIAGLVQLAGSAHKQIRYYSSGMKQRVKLAQAIFSDCPVVLLDEPCTNLDQDGITLYQQLVRDYCPERLVIVSSNDLQEYSFCDTRLDMRHFRPA